MVKPSLLASAALVGLALVTSHSALASPQGVGLGVAAGLNYYQADLTDAASISRESRSSLAWGFFVDIPLLETFYISPAAMLHEIDLGGGKVPVTDIDLNFKFIVPLARARLGAGITAGLTTGLGDYVGHYGLLGYGSFNIVSNIDAFVMVQYKQLRHDAEINNTHAYLGGMFRF